MPCCSFCISSIASVLHQLQKQCAFAVLKNVCELMHVLLVDLLLASKEAAALTLVKLK